MTLLILSFIALLLLLAFGSAIMFLTDPSRVDEEEKKVVERSKWRWRH